MNSIEINPFQQLYVSEKAQPQDFVQLFSHELVKYCLSLFQPGNVIVRGTQGSGKTMLLTLLKPEIREAYTIARSEFPLRQQFVSGGINLTRSDAVGIGQRPVSPDPKEDLSLFPLYFGDFVNYWVVMDLLKSVRRMGERPDVFDSSVRPDKFDYFAQQLATDDCWFGYLGGVSTFEQLFHAIEERIYQYRRFHQYNIGSLPTRISETKTSIGQPISRASTCLKEADVIRQETPVFIRIDQLEFLLESDEIRQTLGSEYRRVINKALSTRDPAISYKIGTRTHAWLADTKVFKSESTLENERDYRIVDLDEILRRNENQKTWVFPSFAENVFRRRLQYAGYDVSEVDRKRSDILRTVLGSGLSPNEWALRYAGQSQYDRAIPVPEEWPEQWREFIRGHFREDPLNTILLSAWLRQREKRSRSGKRPDLSFLDQGGWPWGKSLYWKKERVRQALMQLAARCGQRMYWAGKDQVLSLSGGNILVLISICKHVWETFLRSEKARPDDQKTSPMRNHVQEDIQAIGIHLASTYWLNKISEQPGGHARKNFVEILGVDFRKRLLNDVAMSYPGHNGFSLEIGELEGDPSTKTFIRQAVDYGVLYESPHTTKSADRKPRKKWYLNPVYSPHFGLPETHVKEPIYVHVADVREWLQGRPVEPPSQTEKPQGVSLGIRKTTDLQLIMFDETEDAT